MTKESMIELLKDLYWDIVGINDHNDRADVLRKLNHDINTLEQSEPLRSHCLDK